MSFTGDKHGSIPHLDIDKIKEKRDFYANQYSARVADFIKFTTPLALAAILWIGGSYSTYRGFSTLLLLISLILIFVSIYFAISIFYMTIRYSSLQLGMYQVFSEFSTKSWDTIKSKMNWDKTTIAKFEESRPILERACADPKFMAELLAEADSRNQTKDEIQASYYDVVIKVHLYSLFMGFILYIIATIINTNLS